MPKKKELPTLETGKQCKAAIKEIQSKTDWTLKGIAEKMGMNYETLRKVALGHTKNPGEHVRSAIAEMLAYARAMP